MGIELKKNTGGEEPKKDSTINLVKSTTPTSDSDTGKSVFKDKGEVIGAKQHVKKEPQKDPQKELQKEQKLPFQTTGNTNGESANKGYGKWIIAAIILIAAVGIIYMFTKSGDKTSSEINKTGKDLTEQKKDNSGDKNNQGKDVKDPNKDVKDPANDVKDVTNSGNNVSPDTKKTTSDSGNPDNAKTDKKSDNDGVKDTKNIAKDKKDANNDIKQDKKLTAPDSKTGSTAPGSTDNKGNTGNIKSDDFNSIANFVPNGTRLTSKSISNLNKLVKQLKENKSLSVTITGYTDNKGSDELNKQISKKRAESVYNYLIRKGIDAGRLKYSGVGPANPVSDNNTPQGRYKNRRVSVDLK